MPPLPDCWSQYFSALSDGFEAVLPPYRVGNRALLLKLYHCLLDEPLLTVMDLKHLETVKAMADQVKIPSLGSIKACCEAEAFLIQICPTLPESETRWTIKWMGLLLARHGHITTKMNRIRTDFCIWRTVQTFHPVEQGFLVGLIDWLEQKQFAPGSIFGILKEYQKFKRWMVAQEIMSLEGVDSIVVQRYLLRRANGYAHTSKQKFLGSLRPVFYYYQEVINGGFRIPDVTVRTAHAFDISKSATHEDIQPLWQALEEGNQLPARSSLMLALILGYGLPLRALPLLEITSQPGQLLWQERLPCRRGIRDRIISLVLNRPWLAQLWETVTSNRRAQPGYPYLFTTGYGMRRKQPVSVDHCQQFVQDAVRKVLGYPIPVNHLERGALKRLARLHSLTRFMDLSAKAPKTKQTRMMVWLALNTGK